MMKRRTQANFHDAAGALQSGLHELLKARKVLQRAKTLNTYANTHKERQGGRGERLMFLV